MPTVSVLRGKKGKVTPNCTQIILTILGNGNEGDQSIGFGHYEFVAGEQKKILVSAFLSLHIP